MKAEKQAPFGRHLHAAWLEPASKRLGRGGDRVRIQGGFFTDPIA
jgi:hypothetical protein